MKIIRLRHVLVGAGLLLGVGCEEYGSSDTFPSSARRISLTDGSLIEDLRLDGESLDLAPIGWVAVAPDGSIAFSQIQDRAIRFFDSTGAPVARFGRSGEGPGEFRVMSRNGWIHDTLWVYDGRAGRVTYISPSHVLVRTATLPSSLHPAATDSTLPQNFAFFLPRAVYADGSVLGTAGLGRGQAVPSGYDAKRMPFLLASLDGMAKRVVAWMPPDSGGVEVTLSSGFGGIATPHFAGPLDAVAQDGSRIAFATTSIDGANAGTFLVTLLNGQGDTLFIRRHGFTPEPISRQAADSIIAARIAGTPTPEFKRAYATQVKVPPVYPPLATLLIGRDNTVWVRLRPTADANRWLVLDSSGELVDTVVVPRNVTVHVAERGRIWATASDSNDVQSVVRYRFAPKR